MNIWLVNHYANPPTQSGWTRHFSLARELRRFGHQVVILTSSFDHATQQEFRLSRGERYCIEEIENVPFMWIKTPPYKGNTLARVWNMIAFSYQVLQLARPSRLGKPDLVWGSSPHLFAGWSAERLAQSHKVPFVFEVRDLWPQTLIDLGKFSPKHPFIWLMEKIERYLYRKADRIISLLPRAHLHMGEKGADEQKIVWIPNGIDLNLVPPPEPPMPREDGTFTVMYAGAHGLANNLEFIIESAYIVARKGWSDRIRFRFVGDGPDKPRLMRLASEKGLANIAFDNAVPKQEIYRVLAEADAFVVSLKDSPLYRWGISLNKLFDYMASARPIIFAVTLEANNPVAEAGAGISAPASDPEAVAEAILLLAQMSPQERWEMGLRGRHYVEEHHTFQKLAEKLHKEVLRDFCSPKLCET